MNWKPEFCGICSHGKRGTLLSRLRVLHVLPVAISMVLFSNFLLNHFPFTCDLLYDFFSFDKHFHNFPVFLSSSRRTRARCVRSRGCAVGRGRQAAAGADAKLQTVKFFIQFLCVFFFFYLLKKKKREKKLGKRCVVGTGVRVPLAACGWPFLESSVVSSAKWERRESCCSLSPPCSSCSRAGGAVAACVVLGTSSDKLVSAGRWPVPPSPAWGGVWAVTASLALCWSWD